MCVVLKFKFIVYTFFLLFFSSLLQALTFPVPNGNKEIVGTLEYVNAKSNDTLYDIASEFDLGTLELMEANPKITQKQKITSGTTILLPSSFILPSAPKEGIVLNLAELRIYFFHPDSNLVSTHPVGIGRAGWRTPVGVTKVVRKRDGPTWIPPASIRNSYARKGKHLPASIGPGPNNPLGAYAMNLSWPRYVIHGTNLPKSVGLRSSSGCIRMYAEDIKALFKATIKGTQVRVIHEPIKVGVVNNTIYLEAHEPLYEQYYGEKDKKKIFKQIIDEKFSGAKLDWDIINKELKKTSGYPIAIGSY